jgi:hypothetical protein
VESIGPSISIGSWTVLALWYFASWLWNWGMLAAKDDSAAHTAETDNAKINSKNRYISKNIQNRKLADVIDRQRFPTFFLDIEKPGLKTGLF